MVCNEVVGGRRWLLTGHVPCGPVVGIIGDRGLAVMAAAVGEDEGEKEGERKGQLGGK